MKKFLVAAAAVLISAGAIGGYAATRASGTAFCENVIVTNVSGASESAPWVSTSTTLYVFTDGAQPCNGTILSYQWQRDGVSISGATSATYTTTSSDVGHQIGVHVTGSNASQTSVNTIGVLGSSKLDDEFNNGSGDPSSTTWSAGIDVSGPITQNGWNNISEAPGGYVYLEGAFSDQDGAQDGAGDTSATDTDSTSEPTDGNKGDWTTGVMSTNASMTGARYVESRIWYPCVDSDTGWSTSYGWESSLFQSDLGHSELDVQGNHSRTDWGSPSGQHNSDYILSPGWITWDETGSFDGDHDGDSVASNTDSPAVPAGDDSEPDSDSDDTAVTETSDGYFTGAPTTYNSSTDVQTSKVCGVWNTYGAVIQAHQVDFYFNGALNYTEYSSSTYGTPNMGLSSTYDLTTLPMKTTFSLRVNQSPPNNTAAYFFEIDYIRVNALS